MNAWSRFERACLERHGVADADLAVSHGVARARFHDRTAREGWGRPLPGIRIHPDVPSSVQQLVNVVCAASPGPAAASGATAAWLHGLRARPPDRVSVLVGHDVRPRSHAGVRVRRSRWLEPGDVAEQQRVPVLAVPAMLVSLLEEPPREQLAQLVDVVHRRMTTPAEVLARSDRLGPVAGIGVLRHHCRDLARRRVESIFQEEVAAELERLGYRPERSTRRLDTPDGVGLEIDVPLPVWQVAVEPDGDSHHRTRDQRRRDRRRDAAFAATDWVRVPVDWRDWHLDRDHVLRAIHDAIDAQRRRGIGRSDTPPPAGRRGSDRVP